MAEKALFDPTGVFRLQRSGSAYYSAAPAVVKTVLLGMVALPQMLRLGYDKKLAIGTVCAGGSLGTMVQPSIALIIYGLTGNVSIGDFFTGAVIPALMQASFYLIYILVRCYLNPKLAPFTEPMDLTEAGGIKKITMDICAPGIIIFFVLGSIYGGVASVTEAASVGVGAVLLLAAFRRELKLSVLQESLVQTMRTCGMIIWIGISASTFNVVYNLMGGSRFVQGMILGLDVSPLLIVMLMMSILIFLGMFMDWIGIALLTMPIFVPIITGLGYDYMNKDLLTSQLQTLEEPRDGLIISIADNPETIARKLALRITTNTMGIQ